MPIIPACQAGNGAATGLMQAPPETLEPSAYDVHPGLLDSCFQLLGWCAGVQAGELGDGAALYIPASIEFVRFFRRPAARQLRAEVRVTSVDHARTHRLRGDLRLVEVDGAIILEVIGFEARRAPRAASGAPHRGAAIRPCLCASPCRPGAQHPRSGMPSLRLR